MPKDPYAPENIEATATKDAYRRAAAGKQSAPKAAAEFLKGRNEMKMMEMGEKSDAPKVKNYAPADISPHGDLGVLDDKEMRGLFPRQIKNANAEWVSSQHFKPMGKVRVEASPALMYKGMAAASSIYPQHMLKDHSGLKAGSKPAKQRRGVTAKDHGMAKDGGGRNPSYGMGGNYVG